MFSLIRKTFRQEIGGVMKKRIIAAVIICAIVIAGGVLLFTRNNAEYVEKPDETQVASIRR